MWKHRELEEVSNEWTLFDVVDSTIAINFFGLKFVPRPRNSFKIEWSDLQRGNYDIVRETATNH